MSQKLILIDAYGFLFRAYYVFPKLYNAQNISLGAIYGFTSMLIKLMDEMNTDNVIITFDSGGKNFRHEIYSEYKSNRIDIDLDLKTQLSIAAQVPQNLGVPYCRIEGFEADDLIASFVSKYKDLYEIIIVSSDKDLMQLIDDRVIMYDPLKKIYIKKEDVFNKYQVYPDLLQDFFAIIGDQADNIPGIKGAGPKAALKLLTEFNSLEGILNNIESIKPLSLQQKVTLSKQNSILSKKLISLDHDAPIDILTNIKVNINLNQAISYLKDLEFNSLIAKITSLSKKLELLSHKDNNTIATIANSESDKKNNYEKNSNINDNAISIYCNDTNNIDNDNNIDNNSKNENENNSKHNNDNLKILNEKQNNLSQTSLESLDLRKLSFSSHTAKIKIIKIDSKSGLNDSIKENILKESKLTGLCLINIDHNNQVLLKTNSIIYDLTSIEVIYLNSLIYEIISQIETQIICNDIKALLNLFKFQNIKIKNRDNIDCLNLLHYLLYGSKVSKDFIPSLLEDYSLLEEHNKTQLKEDPNLKIIYFKSIYDYFIKQLISTNLFELYKNIDLPLSYILFDMEDTGIYTDTNLLQILANEAAAKLQILEQKIYQLSGQKFNINSPKQLSEILFLTEMQSNSNSKKKFSTDFEVLDKLKRNGSILADFLIKWRELSKLKNTYLTGLQKFIINNKIHTTLNQTATATGRLSSCDPNLQNIPSKSIDYEQIRNCFIANPYDFMLIRNNDQDQDTSSNQIVNQTTQNQVVNQNQEINQTQKIINKGQKLVFISSDYSQIELRILALLSGTNSLLHAFDLQQDIHIKTASKIFNIDEQEITKEQRSKAKTINFGIIYGMNKFGLAKKLNIAINEAAEYIDKFFIEYKEIKQYMESQISFATQYGFVKNLFGRKCFLNQNLSRQFFERAAINFSIQSTASDLIKIKMIKLQNIIKHQSLPITMVLQVHDELIFTAPSENINKYIDIIKNNMQISYLSLKTSINDLLHTELSSNSNLLESLTDNSVDYNSLKIKDNANFNNCNNYIKIPVNTYWSENFNFKK